ncbi:MAG: hypothetical protein HZA17_13310, partial [Nitrospirae bacterium]|nr:hypothetical protein [Nitrospirota bacterium]
MVKKIIILAFIAYSLQITTNSLFASGAQHYIRVAIIQNSPSINLTVSGPFEISDLLTKKLIYNGKNIRNSRVWIDTGGINISGLKINSAKIQILAKNKASIYINNRRFRGNINIIAQEGSRLVVVNELDIEDYLKGVLYHEISHTWPLEAIKAQAVAARTYALYQASIGKDKDFDVTSDIYSQVYGGRT